MPDGENASALRLKSILQRMASAAAAAGRQADAARLVAVSKTMPVEAIRPLMDAGQRIFGENRVQEAQGKWPALRADHPDTELHLIGPLQTNKALDAVRLFDVIETLDRPKLAHALADAMAKEGRSIRLFVQVNTGAEPQKAGVLPEEADALIRLARDELGLDVVGLMVIPPQTEEPSLHFALLAKIAARNGLKELSMGMSADFETAIALGATYVRIGSALFGPRAP